jgi:ABC-type Na+ transport system ATPase subunit NatA
MSASTRTLPDNASPSMWSAVALTCSGCNCCWGIQNSDRCKNEHGIIPEMSNVYVDLTAKQNVILAGRFYGMSEREFETIETMLATASGEDIERRSARGACSSFTRVQIPRERQDRELSMFDTLDVRHCEDFELYDSSGEP